MYTTEEQDGTGVVDSVEHSALLIHPEGDDVSLIRELLWQGFCPETALGDQVGAGVLGQGVWIDPRRVFGGKTKTQRAAPAALLFSDLEITWFGSVKIFKLRRNK